MKKIIRLTSVIFIVLVCALIGGYFYYDSLVFRLTDGYSIELGESIPTDPYSYIYGNEGKVAAAKVDTSQVDLSKAGSYVLTVAASEKEKEIFTYDIEIHDTVAPTLVVDKTERYVALGTTVSLSDFVLGCEDKSNDVTLSFVDYQTNDITLSELGEKELLISAKDPSGNETTDSVKIYVDPAQELTFATEEKWVLVGKKSYDYLFDVVAIDEEEGRISDIKVDDSVVDLSKAGDYEVIYEVADSHGISTTKSRLIHVCDKSTYNAADRSMSPEMVEKFKEWGFFNYTALSSPNYEAARNLIQPSLLSAHVELGGGKYVNCSAFVYKITPEYVYILTAEHCKKTFVKGVSLTNDAGYKAYNLNPKFVGDDDYDIGMVKISTQSFSSDMLLNLKEIVIDFNIQSTLSVGDEFIMSTTHFRNGTTHLDSVGTIKETTATYQEYQPEWGIPESPGMISSYTCGQTGQSGGPIVNLKGQLMGIVSAYLEGSGYMKNIGYYAQVNKTMYDKLYSLLQ